MLFTPLLLARELDLDRIRAIPAVSGRDREFAYSWGTVRGLFESVLHFSCANGAVTSRGS